MPGIRFLIVGLALAWNAPLWAAAGVCAAESGAHITPVIELYTSEGCSSCPPADRWLSRLQLKDGAGGQVVVQAFHVSYWDYIGWVDRFANPIHTTRQRRVAQWNNQRQIYTPQTVLNGRDWRDWHTAGTALAASTEPSRLRVSMKKREDGQFEAAVTALAGAPPSWGAYWTVTESGHSSRVKSGENAGELLKHDHVVRQYTEAGVFDSSTGLPQRLTLRAVAAEGGRAQRVNLVVYDSRNGRTLQAAAADCSG